MASKKMFWPELSFQANHILYLETLKLFVYVSGYLGHIGSQVSFLIQYFLVINNILPYSICKEQLLIIVQCPCLDLDRKNRSFQAADLKICA